MNIATNPRKKDRKLLFSLAVVLGSLVFLYSPFLVELFKDWGRNDDYSHGYFIPLISAYMMYTMRDKLAEQKLQPVNSGLLIIIFGLIILVVGKIGSEFFLQRMSIIVVLLGVSLFLLGRAHFKQLSLPILYLIFMIPLPAIIWNKFAFPLQLFGSYLTEQVVRLFGIPIFREGNVLHLVETTLEVVAACSGLRSLMTMFALSGLLAFLATMPAWKKYVLFFSAAPTAIIANIIRLSFTALLATKYGSAVAEGFLHDLSGLVVFGIGLSLLVFVNILLNRVN